MGDGNTNTGVGIGLVLLVILLCTPLIIITMDFGTQIDKYTDMLNYHDIDRVDKITIYSLSSSKTIDGRFVIGSGRISNADTYIFYTKNQNGGYIKNRVNSESSVIYTDEQDQPYVLYHYVETDKYKKQFVNNYEFHVPNGTIIEQFGV